MNRSLTVFSVLLTSLSLHAEMLNTGSHDYYMTPPASSVTAGHSVSANPQEQCWYEQVPISGTAQGENTTNVAGAVVGGIIGGIVGHQFGSGDGNTAATVAGAAIGTAIGAGANSSSSTPQYQMIKKCNTLH